MGIQWEYLLFSLESSKKPSAGIPDPFGESRSHFVGQVGHPLSIPLSIDPAPDSQVDPCTLCSLHVANTCEGKSELQE